MSRSNRFLDSPLLCLLFQSTLGLQDLTSSKIQYSQERVLLYPLSEAVCSAGIMRSAPTSFFTAFFLLFCLAEAFAITGISAGVNTSTGERPFRHDINELYMSGPPWDLFILALSGFQQVSQDNPLSYYQVAGQTNVVC